MRRLVAVMGATATGKSDLALGLARKLDGEIVNADALQVYRGLEIGTAKPNAAMRREIPHHLINILEPHQTFSAGEFVRRARAAIAKIRRRGRSPILVGGSGLYLRALLEGLSPLPESDPEAREMFERRLAGEGLPALYQELCQVDPETAERLAPRDCQRILRALEVAHTSGRPLSQWIRSRPMGESPLEATRIGLTMPRSILYDRITARAREMVRRGWVAEVKGLLSRGVESGVPAFQAIGYRQIVRHVLGEWSLESALEDTIRATRRYAKRQETWFRKEKGIRWLSALDPAEALAGLLRELDAAGAQS